MHVALVGFSVSADPHGYAKHLANLSRSAGLYSLEVIGVGGLHPRDMCFLIDRIDFTKKPDLILYEVLTSSARSNAKPASYIRNCLAQLESAATEMEARCGILNLYRDDVDYENDVFLSSAKLFAHERGIALIDLSPDALHIIATIGKANALADVVHPKRDLAKVYADRVHDAILELMAATTSGLAEHHPRGDVIPISPSTQNTYEFERSGLRLACVEIPENNLAHVSLPPGHNLVGIACLMGPETGKLKLRLDDRQVVEVTAYDDRSYYERLGFFYFGSHSCAAVEITQLPGVPDVRLVKGEASTAPRRGRIYGLLVERSASPQ